MKFSTIASVLAISSFAAAGKGQVDKSTPTTVTTYVTQTTHRYGRFNKTSREREAENTGTHRYGRFNKTKKVRTSTVLVSSESEIPLEQRNVVLQNKEGNSSSNSSSSSSAGGAMKSGASLGFAGAIAVGIALVI
ncbi:Hydrophilin PGA14 [Candida viswanathii]|uniref:Hydrophilin PGA14 n=1 Tax=Candida viswanathii TaxID=5486 RepID=A0A367YFY5_9ASCO|nr:Hydrophilin PGA14 [Candida viswanathii]